MVAPQLAHFLWLSWFCTLAFTMYYEVRLIYKVLPILAVAKIPFSLAVFFCKFGS
jgi:hypothetical protein